MTAQVRYVGWTDRDDGRHEDRVTSLPAQLQRSVELPDGGRITFRGRAGRPSQWRTVDDRHTLDLFRESDEFEVREE